VPDETLMTFTGYLVFTGHLRLAPAFIAAFCGSVCGITISYVLGRTFGLALIHRYGKYIWIQEEHVEKAHQWFERVGAWGLTFGYFIPGVRHFTAYAAGISELEPHRFAVFASTGAFVWAATFIGLGYFLGERWQAVSGQIHHHAAVLTVVATALVCAWLVWRKWRQVRR
jgi:membrane protein DedA with SNARE-associated domain